MDLFLRLSDKKYIKVVKNGDYFNKDRLRSYKDHKVETVYVNATDFPKYVDACLQLLKKLVQATRPGVEQDFSLSFQVAEAVFLDLGYQGLNESSLGHVTELGDIFSEQIKKKPKLGEFVEELLTVDNPVARHSVATASIALMILHNLRWQLKRNRDAIVLAALLHDIALLEYPQVYSEDSDNWSEETLDAFDAHPDVGAQQLLDSGVLADKRVADIVRDHEELPNGEGFPRALLKQQIFPMALPLIMADRLAELILDPNSHLLDKSLSRAVRYMQNREESFYPMSYWEALKGWDA